MKTKRVTVQLGGIDDRAIPSPGTARAIANLQWSPEGYWEVCDGAVEVTNFAGGSGPISALHWFNPRPNQRWLITERRVDATTSRIAYADFPAGGTPTTILDRRRLDSGDLGTQFLDLGRWLYMLSPVDSLQRWDGFKVVPVGFQSPAPAPRVAGMEQGFNEVDKAAGTYIGPVWFDVGRQRGVGEVPASSATPWLYGYGATLLNDLGQESPMSAIVFVAGNNSNVATIGKRMNRIQYPRVPQHIRAVRLWRTRNLFGSTDPGQNVDLYPLDTFTFAGGFDYLDLHSDAELGQTLHDRDAVGQVPVGARAMGHWGGSLWLGGMPDDPTVLRYSRALFPEQFPAVNTLPVGSIRSGPIVALKPIARGMLVFKTGGIYMVKGDAVNGFRCDPVDETRGAAAPRAIETVPQVGTFFVDSTGPHVVVGALEDDQPTVVKPLTGGIKKLWRERAGVLLEQAVSVYDPKRDLVWWQIPEGGDPRQTLSLVLSLGSGFWSTWTDWSVGAMAFYDGHVWVGSWDDTSHPGVFVVTPGSRETFGTTLVGGYTTNPLRLTDDPWIFQRVEGVGIALGSSQWNIHTRTDRQLTEVDQSDTAPGQAHHTHEREEWGEGRWDVGGNDPVWQDYELSRFPVSVRMQWGNEHEIRINTRHVRLAHLDLIAQSESFPMEPAPRERR